MLFPPHAVLGRDVEIPEILKSQIATLLCKSLESSDL